MVLPGFFMMGGSYTTSELLGGKRSSRTSARISARKSSRRSARRSARKSSRRTARRSARRTARRRTGRARRTTLSNPLIYVRISKFFFVVKILTSWVCRVF